MDIVTSKQLGSSSQNAADNSPPNSTDPPNNATSPQNNDATPPNNDSAQSNPDYAAPPAAPLSPATSTTTHTIFADPSPQKDIDSKGGRPKYLTTDRKRNKEMDIIATLDEMVEIYETDRKEARWSSIIILWRSSIIWWISRIWG